MQSQDKAAIIAYKYSKKYTENINGGKINYHSVVVEKDSSLILLAKGVKNIQEHLKNDERTIIFVTEKHFHTKALIVTKDYCFINHNDSMKPFIEDALIKDSIKLVPVVPFFYNDTERSYLHSDNVCETTSAKIAKHVAFLSDEELYGMVQKNNSKKENVLQNDITMDLFYFTPKGYATNKMEYYLKLTPNLAANIAKYSQMERFDNQISQFYGFGQDFYNSPLNTKITGNKGNNEGLTFNDYIQKHTDEIGMRMKLKDENGKYEKIRTENSVENQNPIEFFVSTQNLSKNVDKLPIINSATQPSTTISRTTIPNLPQINQGKTSSGNPSKLSRNMLSNQTPSSNVNNPPIHGKSKLPPIDKKNPNQFF